MAYSPGDKIFAKVKGHPHWPSRINLLPEDVPIPKGKYPIFFYGTHEVYFLTPKDIFPYEKFKHKYGVTRNKPAFQAGLREIEENPDVLLYNKDPEAEVFLAQFYSFKRECQNTNVAAQTPSQKRSKSTSAETEHGRLAKRPHTESPNSNSPVKFHPRTSQRGGRSSLTKSKRQSSATEVKTVRPSVQPAPVESANYVPEDSQRVSTLRLRIRKHSTGLILSPDSVSPSSPSTPESTATLEARHAEPERIQPSSDRLKIIIRQNTTMSPIMSTEEKMKQRPVVSVTPTPNTAGSNSINQSEAKRPRSTAVVTPLLRNVLPELSDDSSDSDVSKTDESLKMNSTEKKGKSSYMEEKSENSQNLDLSVHRTHSIRLRRKFSKQVQDSSEITISHVEDSQKTTPITSPELSSSNWHKTVALTSKCGDIKTNSTISLDSIVDSKSDVPSTPNHEISKDKEQQLKDLDTEERLLLIDRSIKSSLVQGHEDIATCVDKLEHLDKMAISLPIMARCWTVVETIRKCRRYKRSLEVKIAAQKVFNKFLQLYATADKNELDLAHAELVKHQQRHMRKHSAMLHKVDSPGGSVSASITSLPPYTGPKSMADLFQLTIRPTKDVHDSKVIHHDTTKNNPETLQSPSSVDATPNSSQAFERCERPTNTITTSCVPSNSATETIVSSMFKSQSPLLHSSSNVGDQLGVSLQDIPLPEEAPVNLTQPKKTTDPSSPITEKTKDFSELLVPEDIDGEFELLDEYEEPQEINVAQPAECRFPSLQFSSEPESFLRNKDVSQSTSAQANFVITPMLNTNCVPQMAYFGSFPPQSVVNNNKLYPYPVFANVQMPSTSVNHNPLITNYSSPSHSHLRTNVETTPPQSSSRAYIPHSLHPSEHPPPPYRPYIPTRCDLEQTHELITSLDMCSNVTKEVNQSHQIIKNGVVSEILQSSKNLHPDSDSRKIHDPSNSNILARETRTPPHRGRSPHALPHPLEHYQRYLTSALSSEDEASRDSTSQRFIYKHHHSSHQSSHSDANSDKIKTQQSPVNDNSHGEISIVSSSGEDLDTRIARLYNLAMRKSNIATSNTPEAFTDARPKVQNPTTNSIGSPPPPPPPLPISQRVLFTHRPQNPLHSSTSDQLTSLSLQRELRMSSQSDHSDNRRISSESKHMEPTINDQKSSGILNAQTQYFAASSSRHRSGSDAVVVTTNHLSEIPSKDFQQQKLNASASDPGTHISEYSAGFTRPPRNSYPRRPFVNHPRGGHQYRVHPRRHYQTALTHPNFPRPNLNQTNVDEPPFSGRRRSGRDDDRDIYSMLGV